MTSTKTQVVGIGFTLETELNGEWVAGGMEPDPAWRVVDSNGHGHFYALDVVRPDVAYGGLYPTLEWVQEPCTMGHGDDCDGEGHYECIQCRETIVPLRRQAKSVWVPGPARYHLTVPAVNGTAEYNIGETEWEGLQTAIAALISDRLAPFLTSWRT